MATMWPGGTPSDEAGMRHVLSTHEHGQGRLWTAGEFEGSASTVDGTQELSPDSPISRLFVEEVARVARGEPRRFPRITRDYLPTMLEGSPDHKADPDDDWRRPDQVRRGIVRIYRELIDFAREVHRQLAPLGHYWVWGGRLDGREVSASDRYKWLHDVALPNVGIGATGTGQQCHVQADQPLGDRTIEVARGVGNLLPLLTAAGACSHHPGTDHMSFRTPMFTTLGSVGYFGWHTFEDYVDTLMMFLEDGRIKGPHDIHPWVKICRTSIEVRSPDMQESVFDAIALHAMMHTLVQYVRDLVDSGRRPFIMEPRGSTLRIEYAMNMAARFGTTNPAMKIPNPFVPGKERLDALLSRLHDETANTARQLGYEPEHRHFFHAMAQGNNGAMRQQMRWGRLRKTPAVLTETWEYMQRTQAQAEAMYINQPRAATA